MSMTSPGISINGRGENSCSINSLGNSGSRSCGVNGARVPGCSGGSMGSGNDGRTLTQTSGIWLSRRRNLECSDMGDITITSHQPYCQTLARYAEYQVDNFGLIHL